MSQTQESFKKDVNDFFDHFNDFEAIARKRALIDYKEVLPLFKIFMDNHKYVGVK